MSVTQITSDTSWCLPHVVNRGGFIERHFLKERNADVRENLLGVYKKQQMAKINYTNFAKTKCEING